jgi:hypothetical protein
MFQAKFSNFISECEMGKTECCDRLIDWKELYLIKVIEP